nr:MAG TPA: hypothetical protein [Caudoviricetes sp.]
MSCSYCSFCCKASASLRTRCSIRLACDIPFFSDRDFNKAINSSDTLIFKAFPFILSRAIFLFIFLQRYVLF